MVTVSNNTRRSVIQYRRMVTVSNNTQQSSTVQTMVTVSNNTQWSVVQYRCHGYSIKQYTMVCSTVEMSWLQYQTIHDGL